LDGGGLFLEDTCEAFINLSDYSGERIVMAVEVDRRLCISEPRYKEFYVTVH